MKKPAGVINTGTAEGHRRRRTESQRDEGAQREDDKDGRMAEREAVEAEKEEEKKTSLVVEQTEVKKE